MIIISIINIIISIIIITIIIIDVTIMELAVASYYYHMYRGIPEVSFTGQVWHGRTSMWQVAAHTCVILTYVCGHLSHRCSVTSHLWPVNDTSGIPLYIRW